MVVFAVMAAVTGVCSLGTGVALIGGGSPPPGLLFAFVGAALLAFAARAARRAKR